MLYIPVYTIGYAKAMDKDGRPLASAFYSGQVGFHDTLFVSTVYTVQSEIEVFLFYRGHHEDITFKTQ